MFVDLSLANTGDIVYMRLFDSKINNHDWGVFETLFRKLFVDVAKFSLVVDTTEATIYAPKWIKKFVGMMLELTPQTNDQVTQFIVIVNHDIIRKMIKQIVKLNQSERDVEFVKTPQEALKKFGYDSSHRYSA